MLKERMQRNIELVDQIDQSCFQIVDQLTGWTFGLLQSSWNLGVIFSLGLMNRWPSGNNRNQGYFKIE